MSVFVVIFCHMWTYVFTGRYVLILMLLYVLICGYMFNMFVSMCSSPYDVTYTHLCQVLYGQIYVCLSMWDSCVYIYTDVVQRSCILSSRLTYSRCKIFQIACCRARWRRCLPQLCLSGLKYWLFAFSWFVLPTAFNFIRKPRSAPVWRAHFDN